MSGLIDIRVPDIGDFTDVPVVEIMVAPGEGIEADQSLVALESDKATLDVPAPEAGELIELLVAEGDRVSEGSLIARLRRTRPDTAGAADAPGPIPPDPEHRTAAALADDPTPDDNTAPDPQPAGHATPSVRKFARELGVDLGHVSGSGRKGRITREDVSAHVKAALRSPAPAPSGGIADLGLPPWPQVDYAAFGPVRREPLSRIARISGPSLARNAMIIPHVTNFDSADITELEQFRKTINAETALEAKMSILPFVVKAVVTALQSFPRFNASLDGDALVIKEYYHIGIATDTPGGLVVPVIRDADRKGVRTIAAEMTALAARARDGRLAPAQMQGGSFTISSLGGIGGTNFAPIINAPEVAILGMTRAAIQPVWDGTAFQPRLMQPLSLAWDHRVVDGVAAAKFLGSVTTTLNDFRRNTL
ncbi:2-oxo acid dehydrogenase subunit E2 [Microbulbifer sp. S227A]|uniref:2-oxo acid dehydrogenase subunit E2 n=1 Tax=Microbulbifer sp. S227A TaxID=3415131 RepID=UPI003C7ED89F